jgi:DNA-binding NarL/FixJ family response regulator
MADQIGLAAALRLAMDFGGRPLYIPKNEPGDDHPIVRAIGRPAALQLTRMFGSETIEIPLGPNTHDAQLSAKIRTRLAAGQSESKIARALRIHIRTVRRHRARLKVEAPTLFD